MYLFELWDGNLSGVQVADARSAFGLFRIANAFLGAGGPGLERVKSIGLDDDNSNRSLDLSNFDGVGGVEVYAPLAQDFVEFFFVENVRRFAASWIADFDYYGGRFEVKNRDDYWSARIYPDDVEIIVGKIESDQAPSKIWEYDRGTSIDFAYEVARYDFGNLRGEEIPRPYPADAFVGATA